MRRFYLSKLIILVAILFGMNVDAFAQPITFTYTGAIQSYTVPMGVTSLALDVIGAKGGDALSSYGAGGCGGRVICKLAVTGGQVLLVYVGGAGSPGNNSCCTPITGGWNGGGASGGRYYGGSGGGASDIRIGGSAISNRVVVAGGGGGGGGPYCSTGQTGGQGGGLTGTTGLICNSTTYCPCYQALGGTQTAGGIGGTCTSSNTGTQTAGGNAYYYGGGGGGGYWGGGGGYYYGAGGGGSSYPATNSGNISGLAHTQGYNCSGNGSIIICPGPIAGTITGATTVCPGGVTTQLSDVGGVTGGIWTSSNVSVASVGASTAIVTGILPGTATITYTVSSSCATGFTTYLMTVLPKPGVYNVTSSGSGFCVGGTGIDIGLDGSDAGTFYQLYLGASPVGSSVVGAGGTVSFGTKTAVGTYTVKATNPSTSCSINMTGSAVLYTTPLPTQYIVSASGTAYCAGGAGLYVTQNTSDVGISYQLYRGATAVGAPVAGTGAALNFGLQTIAGTYSVVATNDATGCVNTMTGTPAIAINPLPTAFTVSAPSGASYCAGGTGVTIDQSGSTSGIKYQLYLGAMPIGPVFTGTGSGFSFGSYTLAGNYTVIATDPATFCTKTMNGSVNVSINPLPNIHTVTVGSGGSYCTGGTGVPVLLSASDAGVSYQVYEGASISGPALTGTGTSMSFGNRTTAGTYTIKGTSGAGCTSTMSGAPTINVNPLPTAFLVQVAPGSPTSYCAGGSGVDITLSFSNTGVSYQLYRGSTPVGGALSGTGGMLDFGMQTAAGVYTVRGTNLTTTCSNNMTGSVTVSINLPPAAHTVTGGGSYCAGTTGLVVGLNGSASGISYQLINAGVPVGAPVSGTGGTISFGAQTLSGAYTVVATNTTTGCISNMTGSANITIKPLPNPQMVTGGGGYCAGSTGVNVGIAGSDVGIAYQLYNGLTPVGTAMAGTGSPIDFGIKTGVGTYTVKGSNGVTTCSDFMTGSVTIAINPAPNTYTVMGGGNYCAGTAGSNVKLSFSNVGIDYQLLLNGNPIDVPVAGTGAAIDFGMQTGLGVYTVLATNTISGCAKMMTGAVTVTSSALPTGYAVSADNSGNYCAGEAGVHVTLLGSNTGVRYQLYLGSSPVGAPKNGTNSALDFGLKTTPGVYTIVGTNATTGCMNTMIGSATITINPLPNVHSVSGDAPFCAGGAGANIYLNLSDIGIDYTPYVGGTPGSMISGTGSMLTFGPLTTTGAYSIKGTDQTTGCSVWMSGTAPVATNPLPTQYTVTGGGALCAGAAGKHINLSGSNTGISYSLTDGMTTVATKTGTGSALDFGAFTTAGMYTVVATNTTTTCTNNMISAASVMVNPLPTVDTVNGGGTYCAGTTGVPVGLNNSVSTMNYQLYNGGFPVGGSLLGSGTPLTFGIQTAGGTYTVIATDPVTGCTNDMYSNAVVIVTPVSTPAVTSITASTGLTVCSGTAVTYTAAIVNGGLTPMYQWKINTVDVPGETNSTYTGTPSNTDVVSVEMTSSESCITSATASNSVTMTVNPKSTPTATILTDPATTVCPGTEVTYHAVAHSAGLAPTYVWFKNGNPIPAGTDVFTVLTPANNDVISVKVTSSATCTTTPSVTVAQTMVVTPVVTPTNVKLTSTAGKNIIANTLDTIKVTYATAGPNPTFEWRINGITISGETSNMLIRDNFNNHDSITAIVTGSGDCGGTSVAGSLSLLVRNTTGVAVLNGATTDMRIVPNPNKGTFSVKGSLANAGDQQVTLEITNMVGQTVYKNNVTAQDGSINEQIQLSNTLANGMYILSVRSGSENSVFHFVIEQ